MRIQRRDGGPVHHGRRNKTRGGYEISCKRLGLVPFGIYKRATKDINCPGCLTAIAGQKAEKFEAKRDRAARKDK